MIDKKFEGFKGFAEEMLLKCEILFFESDPPISFDEAKKRTQAAVHRLLIIFDMISPLIELIKIRGLPGKGLELGTGYGALILSLAKVFPEIEWTGVEHPKRRYLKNKKYWNLFDEYSCNLKLCDITQQPLPFENENLSLITFSEVLEHLPVEKVLFVIKEMQRVLCPGGWIIASSPNLVSLLNRLAIVRGKGIFALPIPLEYAGETYGHIHLYTAEEFNSLCRRFGLQVRQTYHASRFLKYKQSPQFWKTMAYKICWVADILCRPVTKRIADTWYVILQKSFEKPVIQSDSG